MDLALLDERLSARGEPRFRAQQVWAWLARGASGYDAMTDLPAALRRELEASLPFSTLTVGRESVSRDGTVLTASEIVDQALHFRRLEPVDHCVFMAWASRC